MERNKRLYPIDEEQFNKLAHHRGQLHRERPPAEGDALRGLLRDTRTGVPWRDLPGDYGEWHTIYDRFNRGNARGLWNKVLATLQQEAGLGFEEVIIDSTTMKVHRHGGGQKGGFRARGCHGPG